ncbi:uncharacterized protein BP5553_03387 [Venustampulla echinocandica]|uniref:Uncharacterized protein n=1 Tax=Venustampulla echinocandica TaxID=2656787 RepID=A0A370TU38_9HELO|nr:uncharacterized protein BP5553_03387 [Venustampulla echinocandica]RDL39047.1 hypothetical protein BP5553_03387 [Venustampulla echinocandica]
MDVYLIAPANGVAGQSPGPIAYRSVAGAEVSAMGLKTPLESLDIGGGKGGTGGVFTVSRTIVVAQLEGPQE